jgi:type VI secretion system protein ImpK
VPAWVAGAFAVALLCGGWWWLADGLGASADGLEQRMAVLPPEGLPGIDRSAPPVPPAPPPPPPPPPPNVAPKPNAVPKLRQLLAPEIAQGLVLVQDDPQRVLIRLRNRGMFGSGSATVDPRFADLLRRVGEALRDEPGRVEVVGHSDNVPIRTVRFASNHALSEARAQAAMALIAAANGTPARFTAAGRADAEPIAPNTTPEGREENRRIEVVLLRETR